MTGHSDDKKPANTVLANVRDAAHPYHQPQQHKVSIEDHPKSNITAASSTSLSLAERRKKRAPYNHPHQHHTELRPREDVMTMSSYAADASPVDLKLHQFWSSITCGEFVQGQTPIVIDAEVATDDACEILVNNGIHSAPVFNQATNRFEGIFDYADVATLILGLVSSGGVHLSTIDENKTLQKAIGSSQASSTSPNLSRPHSRHTSEAHEALMARMKESLSGLQLKEVVSLALESHPVPVKLAADLSRKNPFVSFPPESTMLAVVDALSSGIHSVCILDPNATAEDSSSSDGNESAKTKGGLIGVISQTAVIRFACEQLSQLPEELLESTLSDLGLTGTRPVYTVNAEDLVVDALAIMQEKGVSSVAIVSKATGSLFGNISTSDIKHVLWSRKFHTLHESCATFFSHVRSRETLENGGQDTYPYFDVIPSNTFSHALQKLVAVRTHRLWIVEQPEQDAEAAVLEPREGHHPIGVISVTDVLQVLNPRD